MPTTQEILVHVEQSINNIRERENKKLGEQLSIAEQAFRYQVELAKKNFGDNPKALKLVEQITYAQFMAGRKSDRVEFLLLLAKQTNRNKKLQTEYKSQEEVENFLKRVKYNLANPPLIRTYSSTVDLFNTLTGNQSTWSAVVKNSDSYESYLEFVKDLPKTSVVVAPLSYPSKTG